VMRSTWGAWAGVVAALAGGCFVVDPFDKDCPTEPGVGMLGACCSPPSTLACAGHLQKLKLICDPDRKWVSNGTCDGAEMTCDTTEGPDQGTCKPIVTTCKGRTPGDVFCDGASRVKCGPDLVTTQYIETCPGVCVAGRCVATPSCTGLPSTCGSAGDERCCEMDVVPGGTYDRSNDKMYPATVSNLWLDRFEITVGRFRAFVAAYPGNRPKAGDGAHPLIAGSGWDPAWDVILPAGKAALTTAIIMSCTVSYTWTDAPGMNENLPMNCITWFEAFAFCAWDGGRLPTEAEWNYAAAGGDEQRQYPWGSALLDPTHAVYGGEKLMNVGSKPAGYGKWGQADLAGGLWEWNLDWYADPYANPCDDCANLVSAPYRVMRGGSWSQAASYLPSSFRLNYDPMGRSVNIGARCARTP
jgi:formylglycine-generating enzyme